MMATAKLPPEETSEPTALFGWIFAASILCHGVGLFFLPRSAAVKTVLRPTTIEVTEPPPAPPPPPPPPPTTAADRAAAQPAPVAARPTRPLASPSTPQPSQSEPTPASNDVPLDFTGFGNGTMDVVRGTSGAAPLATFAPSAAPKPAAPPPPPFVPAASLARAPSAPGVDTELERNYPAEARRGGISGKAVLRIEVLPDGRIGKVVRVSESHPGFGDACTKTVRAARWEPPIDKDGRKVATEINYVCRFEVRS